MRPPAPHGGPSDNNTPRQPKLSINKKPRPLAGIFVWGMNPFIAGQIRIQDPQIFYIVRKPHHH